MKFWFFPLLICRVQMKVNKKLKKIPNQFQVTQNANLLLFPNLQNYPMCPHLMWPLYLPIQLLVQILFLLLIQFLHPHSITMFPIIIFGGPIHWIMIFVTVLWLLLIAVAIWIIKWFPGSVFRSTIQWCLLIYPTPILMWQKLMFRTKVNRDLWVLSNGLNKPKK